MELVFEYRPKPDYVFPRRVMLSSEQRTALDRLKSQHRMSYSEVLRLGVELVAEKFASERSVPGAIVN